jgi:hypothetical protein
LERVKGIEYIVTLIKPMLLDESFLLVSYSKNKYN